MNTKEKFSKDVRSASPVHISKKVKSSFADMEKVLIGIDQTSYNIFLI